MWLVKLPKINYLKNKMLTKRNFIMSKIGNMSLSKNLCFHTIPLKFVSMLHSKTFNDKNS